ncbi:MAG: hypothetical protein ACFFD4_26235 [Candidatus Odinarchaeota archaeon]
MSEYYDLYWNETGVGRIEHVDSDFPNLWGVFKLDAELKESDHVLAKRLLAFIDLSIEDSKLLEVEHEKDVSREREEINRKLDAFIDLIETDDWYLIDQRRGILPILSPAFFSDGTVVWRWNPK